MTKLTQKTFMADGQTHKREWLLVDASGIPLGRLASQVAAILRGKHKPTFTPHADTGDYVIVINSDKVILTGKKMEDKYFWSNSGFIGGNKLVQAKELLKNKSDFAVSRVIKGMLPKNSLGREMFRKLNVYKGDSHPHAAQQPKKITLVGGGK
jgi:large subunit ribosomal protein L13